MPRLTPQEIDAIAQKHGVQTTPTVTSRKDRLASVINPPSTVNAMSDTPVIGQLSNFGIGIGSAIGKAGLGLGEAALKTASGLGKLVGADTSYADKYVEANKKIKDELYQKPFEKSLETTSGKAGEVIGNVLPYIATAGAVNPVTTKLPRFAQILSRTAPDLIISAGQTSGDVKATAGAGITSAVANALLPGSAQATKLLSKEGAKQFGKELIPGYVSDVTSGLSGQRGEERESVKALIPGAGTALSAGLSLATHGASKAQETFGAEGKAKRVEVKRKAELTKIAEKYPSINKAIEKGKAQGVDLIDMASKSSLLDGAVDETGSLVIRGEDGAIARLNKVIEPYEDVINQNLVREGNKVKFKDVQKALTKSVEDSGLMGGALIQAENKLADDLAGYSRLVDNNGYVSVADIHKAKVNKYSTINYENEATKQADKAIAKGLKELIENNTTSVEVGDVNKELSKIYAFQNFLEKLDNKKVQGGKLGKYFAQVLGGMVGSHFGPFGTVIGAEIAGGIKGKSMAGKFGGTTGQDFEVPEVVKKASETAKSPRPLPATIEGQDYTPAQGGSKYAPINLTSKAQGSIEAQAPSANPDYSSKSLGSLNTPQSTNANIPSNVISKSISQSIDAVNEGLKDPTLARLYDDSPVEFVGEMKKHIVESLGTPDTAVEAQIINAIPDEIGFEKFGKMVKKILGDDLPNKQGGFIKNPLTGESKLYHGSDKSVSNFDVNMAKDANYGKGIYFSDNPKLAEYYSTIKTKSADLKNAKIEDLGNINTRVGKVTEATLLKDAKIKVLPENPSKSMIEKAKADGYDGVKFKDTIVKEDWDSKLLGNPPKDGNTTMLFNSNKVNVSNPLIQEAKKYKSASDLNLNTVYRATKEDFNASNLKTSGKGTGLYVTSDKNFAKGFLDDTDTRKAKEVRKMETLKISPNAKVLTRDEFPPQFKWDYDGGTVKFEDLKKLGGSQGLQDKVASWALKNGYDLVDYSQTNGKNIIILNPNVIY